MIKKFSSLFPPDFKSREAVVAMFVLPKSAISLLWEMSGFPMQKFLTCCLGLTPILKFTFQFSKWSLELYKIIVFCNVNIVTLKFLRFRLTTSVRYKFLLSSEITFLAFEPDMIFYVQEEIKGKPSCYDNLAITTCKKVSSLVKYFSRKILLHIIVKKSNE